MKPVIGSSLRHYTFETVVFMPFEKRLFLTEKTVMPAKKIAYIMPSDWHVNIDKEKDFLLAEVLAPRWIELHQL
jgi:hypothetical protein